MQPGPSEASNTTTLAHVTNDNNNASQHGLPPTVDSASPDSQPGRGGLEALQSAHAAAANEASISEDGRASEHTDETARLKQSVTPPHERISQHEDANSTPRYKNEGPAFVVTKKSRKAGDTRSPVADLPNGTYYEHTTKSNNY